MRKTYKKKYKKGGFNSSKKNIEKKLDILFDDDIQKNVKIKKFINNLCNDEEDEIYNYEGINFDKKNKQVLLLIAKKLNLKNMEKLNENEICQKLQFHHLPSTKFYHPSKHINSFISTKNNFIHDKFRPQDFINNVKNKLQSLTLENKLVYNSVFINDSYTSTHQKALWMSGGKKILKQMSDLQLEIIAVLDANGSTLISDLFSRKKRVNSTTFFSKLNERQRKQLEDIYNTLNYDINRTKEYLIKLDTKEIRDEISEIRKGVRDQNNEEREIRKEEREERQHQWKREKRWEDYEKHSPETSKLLKGTDLISEKNKLNTYAENAAKEVLKSKSVKNSSKDIYDKNEELINSGKGILRKGAKALVDTAVDFIPMGSVFKKFL